MKNKLLLIIPAYNEEDNIIRVVQEIKNNFTQYDYIVINDGSTDDTSAICHREGYNIVDLPVNLGLAGAFQTGMKYAHAKCYECAMQFDADGQHRADYIEKLYQALREGADVVIGSRFIEQKKPISVRMLGSRLIGSAIHLTSRARLTDPTSGMRLYSSKVCAMLADNINYGPEPDTISFLIKKGFCVREVQVEMEERTAGKSYLSVGRSIMYMVRMLVSILVIQGARK